MMQTKFVTRKQIYNWSKKPMFNIVNPELQGGTTGSHNIGQINVIIRPNVNNDREETIHIMTDSNLQHVFNLCTIIDLNLPDGKQQIMVTKGELFLSRVEEKMSQHPSDFSL